MNQVDLICGACPLIDCDEESLWCLYCLGTDPNKAQRKAILPGLRRVLSRKDYFARHYQINRDKKLSDANRRNAEKRAVQEQ
jgi:hypothetical protein